MSNINMKKFCSAFLYTIIVIITISACSKSDIKAPDNKDDRDIPILDKSEKIRGIKLTNVDSQGMKSKANLQKVVNDCLEIGLNTIFVCVWNNTYTLYPSSYMEQMFGEKVHPDFANRDVLEELLELTNGKGIDVFAWMEYGFAAKWGDPATGGRLLQQKPEWASRDIDGNIASENGFQWMDPFNPDVQNFMINLIKEVSTKYKIKGVICCDRLPALPVRGGYNQYIRTLYKSETGFDVPTDFKESKWVKWRADKLTIFQSRLYDQMKTIRPDIVMAFSPSPYLWSLENYLQDWEQWIKNGKVDFILPQLYRFSLSDYKYEVDKNYTNLGVLNLLKDKKLQFAPAMILNTGSTYVSESDLREMLLYNRSRGFKGEAFFFYGALEKYPAFKTIIKEHYKNY